LNLKCDFLVFKFVFKFNLYRYSLATATLMNWEGRYGADVVRITAVTLALTRFGVTRAVRLYKLN
jgi:hypothetical protein